MMRTVRGKGSFDTLRVQSEGNGSTTNLCVCEFG